MTRKFLNDAFTRLAFALMLVWSLNCGAVQSGNSIDFNALNTTLNTAVDTDVVAGVSLLLLHGEEVIYKEAYGNIAVTDVVKMASSTKPEAAVSLLMLVDDGKLDLDDTLGSWLPEFTGTVVENATVRQLLSHTAGILGLYPDGRPLTGTLAKFSRLIASRGDLIPPGTFNYSGVSMDIACRVAEVVAGITYEEHLQTRLWQPLEMSDSSFVIAADPASVSAAELARGEGRWVSCGGGMGSTLDNQATFYQMLAQGGSYKDIQYLSEEMFYEMTSKQALNPIKEFDPYTTGEYGLGIYRDRVAEDGSPITISHGGALGTLPWADLDTRLVGVFFSQTQLRDVKPIIAEIQDEVRLGVTEPPVFGINKGMNDAWFNPLTPGQGFFLTVFENTQTMFLGWFTYDVERPASDVEAILGDPGHRWITAQGNYIGDSAELDVYVTNGGVFDSAGPADTSSELQGTLRVQFIDCFSRHYQLRHSRI